MTDAKRMGSSTLVLIAVLAGTLIAAVLGFLTFGAQATASPDGVPVAVSVPVDGPAAPALEQAAQRVAAQAGDRLDVRVTTDEQARALLHDKEVYGVLRLDAGPAGPEASVVVSGAVNPAGTQIAQQALTGAGEAVTGAIAAQNPQLSAASVRVEQVNAASAAGRTAPLAISALAWVGCMIAGAALTVLADRDGTTVRVGGRILAGAGVGVLLTGLLVGFLWLWDSALPLGWDVIGLIGLTTLAFAAVQGGLLHWLGIKAMAIIAPLYLIAPAVAGQVPELLHPGYRAGLWSWTPFRFPTEALRSLLNGTPDAPDVILGVWVLTGILAVGLILLAIPKRSTGEPAEANPADRVVDVGVDQADRLPSA